VSENLIGASPETVSGPSYVIPPRTGAFRHENANRQLAAHLPDTSGAGMP
jgi:hypothetical protein